jgi:hypothetical protein
MVDVRSIWRMVANSESHADRFVTQHFPDIGPGTKRIQWKGETKKGTVVARAYLVARKLRWFRRGKCQASLKLADELDAAFPKAQYESMFQSIPDDNDTSENESCNAKRKRKHSSAKPACDDEFVTIYNLIYLPTNKKVYTGCTNDPNRRLNQHASKWSKCRLVRNAFRKFGRKNFSLEVIMRCKKSDAGANESHWIIQSDTMYPNGYNLCHGSMAGEDSSASGVVVTSCTGVIPFEGFADEARACAEAWQDVADIAEGIDDVSGSEETSKLCLDFLRQVHPDSTSGHSRSFSANEVTSMLNAVRDSLV